MSTNGLIYFILLFQLFVQPVFANAPDDSLGFVHEAIEDQLVTPPVALPFLVTRQPETETEDLTFSRTTDEMMSDAAALALPDLRAEVKSVDLGNDSSVAQTVEEIGDEPFNVIDETDQQNPEVVRVRFRDRVGTAIEERANALANWLKSTHRKLGESMSWSRRITYALVKFSFIGTGKALSLIAFKGESVSHAFQNGMILGASLAVFGFFYKELIPFFNPDRFAKPIENLFPALKTNSVWRKRLRPFAVDPLLAYSFQVGFDTLFASAPSLAANGAFHVRDADWLPGQGSMAFVEVAFLKTLRPVFAQFPYDSMNSAGTDTYLDYKAQVAARRGRRDLSPQEIQRAHDVSFLFQSFGSIFFMGALALGQANFAPAEKFLTNSGAVGIGLFIVSRLLTRAILAQALRMEALGGLKLVLRQTIDQKKEILETRYREFVRTIDSYKIRLTEDASGFPVFRDVVSDVTTALLRPRESNENLDKISSAKFARSCSSAF